MVIRILPVALAGFGRLRSPATGGNTATGGILTAGGIGNNFKISASCNGARPNEVSFAFSEFFVDPL